MSATTPHDNDSRKVPIDEDTIARLRAFISRVGWRVAAASIHLHAQTLRSAVAGCNLTRPVRVCLRLDLTECLQTLAKKDAEDAAHAVPVGLEAIAA